MNLRERFALHAGARPPEAAEVANLPERTGPPAAQPPVVANLTERAGLELAPHLPAPASEARTPVHAPSGRGAVAPDISRVRGEAYAHGVYRLFVHSRGPLRAPATPAKQPAPAPEVTPSTTTPRPPHEPVTTTPPRPPHEPVTMTLVTPPIAPREPLASRPAHLATPQPLSPPTPQPDPPHPAFQNPLALGPDIGGIVRRVVDWPLTAGAHPFLPGARSSLLGGALARLALPDGPGLRELVPRLLANIHPGEGRSPVVFLDVETTALDRGAGALAFMVGIAAFVDGALRVEQWILTRLSSEAAMLAEVLARVTALAGPGAVLASFNGASFDVPLLRTRLRRGGVQPIALERPHLDLLPPSRRMWRGRGPDCRLVTLERTQLAVRRVHDIAGHEIPAVFWAWLRRPDDPEVQAVMTRVADHNLADLVTLPALAAALGACLRAPADLDTAIRAAEHCVIGGRRGDALRVLEAWHPAIRRGVGPLVQRRRALMLTADLLRREPTTRTRAAELWAEVCRISPGDPDAHEALAKHLEHHAGDLARALEVARASAAPCPRRLARLQRKLTGSRSVLGPLRSGHLSC